MSLFSKSRVLLSTLACVSLSAVGLVSPALAQDASRVLYLGSGESAQVSGVFVAGENIYAACNFRECNDLDLYLFDGYSGEMISADEEVNTTPYLVAPYDGEFYVTATMYGCNSGACEVTIGSDYGF